MDIIHAVSSLLMETWVQYSIIAAFGYAVVEFIDEKLLHDLKPEGESHEHVNSVGTLVLISGFFGLVISVVLLVAVLAAWRLVDSVCWFDQHRTGDCGWCTRGCAAAFR